MKSTTIIAFDQHAATTVAAVLLPGHRTPALHTLPSEQFGDSSVHSTPPPGRPGAVLLRSGPLRL